MPHGALSKPVVVSNVRTTGYAGNLAKGELAIVKNKAVKGQGAVVVSSFAGMTAQDQISFRVGEYTTPANLRTKEVASQSTGFFPIGSIVDIKAYAPTNVELKVDEIELGYDGINEDTGLYIPEGKSAAMDIVVYGEVASVFFGRDHYRIEKRAYREVGETMQQVIERLVAELNDDLVPAANGYASTTDKLSQYLDIKVINSETTAITNGVESVFSTLTVEDNGDSNDLGDIQAQYPAYKVERTDRIDRSSTYTILHPESVTLADYVKTTVKTDGKGCEDCQAGYTLIPGGYVYHVSLEDDGANSTATVQAIPGAIAGSAVKLGNKDGRGTYSVVLTAVLTSAQETTFTTANPTSELSLKGDIIAICSDTDTVTTAWVDGETCVSTTKDYSIILKDNECGQSRLTELQAYYPDLTIVEGGFTGGSTQTATITGTTGNLSLVIGGTTYSVAFTTDLATTVALFVSTHAATILSAKGVTVTGATTVLTFKAPSEAFPTITATAGGLTETLSAVTADVATSVGGCKRVYSTTVNTNIVCDECSDIYLQPFVGQAPEPFEEIYWKEAGVVYSDTAKMGISIKGKPFYLYPEIYEEDFIPFYETSLKVLSASFGWRQDDILNYTGSTYDPDLEFARAEKLQYAVDVNNLGRNFFGAERMGALHYTNKTVYDKNLFARSNFSQERKLDYHSRYVQYHIMYRDQLMSQGGASRSDITHDFMIIIKEGENAALQTLLGSLAAKVGLPAPRV